MSGHRVTSPKQRVRICWAIGCHAAAEIVRNARYYCSDHAGPPLSSMVTDDQLRAARNALSSGASLADVCATLDLSKSALDLALWRNLGQSSFRIGEGQI